MELGHNINLLTNYSLHTFFLCPYNLIMRFVLSEKDGFISPGNEIQLGNRKNQSSNIRSQFLVCWATGQGPSFSSPINLKLNVTVRLFYLVRKKESVLSPSATRAPGPICLISFLCFSLCPSSKLT